MLDLNRTVTVGELVKLAGGLCSEHGENSEYDRALAELVADAGSGSIQENRDEAAQLIHDASPARKRHGTPTPG